MPRGRPPMPWIKWHYSFLDSSINYEMDLAQQAIYLKICLYASNCGNKAGAIADNDGKPIPDWFVANCIHAPVETVQETIKIGLATNRFSQNGTGVIEIINWKYYQSEYARQKPFRDAKKQAEQDPDRFIKGKYGHMVARSKDDVKRLKMTSDGIQGNGQINL